MSFWDSLVSGGVAGTCVDLVFFPIDTLKTRLQAKNGFFANGGWKGVYSGVGSTIVASAPGAAVFFVVYDGFKSRFAERQWSDPVSHMTAASIGEIAACTIRVPSEVIKQRVQTGQHNRSINALLAILRNTSGEGVARGLYRGYGTTLMREIPFTAVQFPLYEKLKKLTGANEHPYMSAFCGSVAGGFAAAITTPLDVIKTRVMLRAHDSSSSSSSPALSLNSTDATTAAAAGTTNEDSNSIRKHTAQNRVSVIREVRSEGWSAFFKGVVPRTLWISAGGAVFLGVYEVVKASLSAKKDQQTRLI